MTDDRLARLRIRGRQSTWGDEVIEEDSLLLEAADEIERLRAELRLMAIGMKAHQDGNRQATERAERAEAEIERQQEVARQVAAALRIATEKTAFQEAEIERLREWKRYAIALAAVPAVRDALGTKHALSCWCPLCNIDAARRKTNG